MRQKRKFEPSTTAPKAIWLSALPRAADCVQRNWIQWFVLSQIGCQLILLTRLTTGPLRILVRIAAFSLSLVFLALLSDRSLRHPAAKPAIVVIALVGLGLLNPGTAGIVASAAQIALYVAILSPLFWIPCMKLDMKMLRAVLLTFWAFYSLSALFGILQVYYPGQFQPHLSATVAAKGIGYVKSLMYELPNGQRVLRPMGLSDLPGGAGVAGFYAGLLSLAFLLVEKRAFLRSLFIVSMVAGITCIYLSQVRSMLVLFACSAAMLCVILAFRGSKKEAIVFGTVVAGVVVVGFLWATTVGGRAVKQRIESLSQDSPAMTYYKNRGGFLEYTVMKLLPEYPLGAGLGRWGMTNEYFGDRRQMIWVEIMWTGWLLDGGVPLVLAYVVTLIYAFRVAFRIAMAGQSELGSWGAVMVAFNFAAFAQTFNSPIFIGQLGLEFWVLNATLFAAARTMADVPPPRWIYIARDRGQFPKAHGAWTSPLSSCRMPSL